MTFPMSIPSHNNLTAPSVGALTHNHLRSNTSAMTRIKRDYHVHSDRFTVLIFYLAMLSLSIAYPIVTLPYNECLYLSDLLFSILAVTMLIQLAVYRMSPAVNSHSFMPQYLVKPWLFFTLIVLIGSLTTLYYRSETRDFFTLSLWGPTLFYAYRYAIYLIAFIISYSLFGSRILAVAGARLILLSGLLVVLVIVAQWLNLIPDLWPIYSGDRRFSHVGPLSPHRGHAAAYIIILTSLAVQACASKFPSLPRSVLLPIIPLNAFAMFATGRRSGWLALLLFLALAFACLIAGHRTTKRALHLIIVLFVSFLLMLLYLLNNPTISAQFSDVFDLQEFTMRPGGNFEGRVISATEYIRYFVKEPINFILGCGFASTLTYIVIYGGPFYKNLGGAHNQYVTILVELGLPGLAIFLWLLFAMLRAIAFASSHSTSLKLIVLSSTVCLFIYSLGGGIFYYGSLMGNLTAYFMVVYALQLRLLHFDKASPSQGLSNPYAHHD